MSVLWQARFFTTVNRLQDLPKYKLPEVAFAGRSNAGKSSAINLLCNQKKLAFASKTPGRTQHINFFSIGGAHVAMHRKDATRTEEIRAFLVDLPGYGYAEVSGTAKHHWQDLLGRYVQAREQLSALVLIMDARRPFTELDVEMLEWFAPTGKPIHCLLSKADKLNRSEQADQERARAQVERAHFVLLAALHRKDDDRHGGSPPQRCDQIEHLAVEVGVSESLSWVQCLLDLRSGFDVRVCRIDYEAQHVERVRFGALLRYPLLPFDLSKLDLIDTLVEAVRQNEAWRLVRALG